jgi:DNA processing protein
MTEQHRAYVYSLAHLSHLGERSALKVKRIFPTYDDLIAVPVSDRRDMIEQGVGPRYSTLVSTNWDEVMEHATRELRRHQLEEIIVLTVDDASYPPLLRRISDPPLVLFVKGSVKSLTECINVAIVGTRDSTPKGEAVATRIAKFFGTRGLGIVSGLAKGIDTAAHKGALEANAVTVAVFGTPFDKIYPAENKHLAENILRAGGSWVSEIPLGKGTHRNSFVQRDRIQSGISVAVIPVQTDIQGGTMHTVEFAEKQVRLVLCPRPLNGERHLKQYAGIVSLIESKRATAFQFEDYEVVLNRVFAHASTLKDSIKDNFSRPWQASQSSSLPGLDRPQSDSTVIFSEEKHTEEVTIQQLIAMFTSLGLSKSKSSFETAISKVRKRLYGGRGRIRKGDFGSDEDSNMQVFKARLSRPIDETLFAEKWRQRSGGIDVRFRIKGTDLTAIHTRTLWDSSSRPGSGGFFNVLQMTLHDVAQDCSIVDCEEITSVNS